MPRRRVAEKRRILPDPKFGSEVISRFVNCILQSGKKSLAIKIVYGALDQIASHLKDRPALLEARDDEGYASGEGEGGTGNAGLAQKQLPELMVFLRSLDHIRPTVEVRARRVGGATYQIPCEVRPSRRTALAMRWLKEAARQRPEKTMALRLAAELLDAFEEKGIAVKRRQDTHRMAKANQAFAHFRWT